MQPTHLQDGDRKVKFLLKILEKIQVGSETIWKKKSDPDPKKSFRIHNSCTPWMFRPLSRQL